MAFRKLTELATDAIDRASLPGALEVTVLFDAFYFCPTVARVVRDCLKRWSIELLINN